MQICMRTHKCVHASIYLHMTEGYHDSSQKRMLARVKSERPQEITTSRLESNFVHSLRKSQRHEVKSKYTARKEKKKNRKYGEAE